MNLNRTKNYIDNNTYNPRLNAFKTVTTKIVLKESDFPDFLGSSSTSTSQQLSLVQETSNSTAGAFRNALLKKALNVQETVLEEYVEPGWVEIRRSPHNGRFYRRYGHATARFQERHDEDLATALAFERIVNNYERYKIAYDEMHGDGAYDEFFQTSTYTREGDGIIVDDPEQCSDTDEPIVSLPNSTTAFTTTTTIATANTSLTPLQ